MAAPEQNYATATLPKELIKEIKADAEHLAKQQGRLRPPSVGEMVTVAYRFYKQRRNLK